MPLSLYIAQPTILHRLHPTVKVLGLLAFFVAAFVCESPWPLLPLAAGIATLLTYARAWPNVRRLRWLFLLVFVMTFIVWSLFFRGGMPLYSLGPVSVSTAGTRYALGMAIKLVCFLAIGTLFLTTTRIEELAFALTRIGIPYKLGFAMTLAFRLVPVFVDSAFSVIQAQRCRGFRFDEGNLLRRARRYVPVLVPVFIGALRRADGMAIALEARGFQSKRQRTTFEQYPFGARDGLGLALVAGVAVIYLAAWKVGWLALTLA